LRERAYRWCRVERLSSHSGCPLCSLWHPVLDLWSYGVCLGRYNRTKAHPSTRLLRNRIANLNHVSGALKITLKTLYPLSLALSPKSASTFHWCLRPIHRPYTFQIEPQYLLWHTQNRRMTAFQLRAMRHITLSTRHPTCTQCTTTGSPLSSTLPVYRVGMFYQPAYSCSQPIKKRLSDSAFLVG